MPKRIPVLHDPAPTLRIPSVALSAPEYKDPSLASLIADMFLTMEKENGIGLAAPQIGINKRLIVIDDGELRGAFINPKIISASDRLVESDEGCLSVPQQFGIVKRHDKIKVKALDEHGLPVRLSVSGLSAIVFQHEIDHLDGVLFIDKAIRMTNPDKGKHI